MQSGNSKKPSKMFPNILPTQFRSPKPHFFSDINTNKNENNAFNASANIFHSNNISNISNSAKINPDFNITRKKNSDLFSENNFIPDIISNKSIK